MEKLSIRKSLIEGKGVFAEKSFKRGSKIFRFSNQDTYWHGESCKCRRCQYSIRISVHKELTPDKKSFGWYLNHSCNANASIEGRDIIALKNIKSGEEITIDYSMNIPDENWKMNCKCNSKYCRKILKSIQYVPKAIFEKHRGKIPKFLEKVYLGSDN